MEEEEEEEEGGGGGGGGGGTAPLLCNVSNRFVCKFRPRLELPPEQPRCTGVFDILRREVYFLT